MRTEKIHVTMHGVANQKWQPQGLGRPTTLTTSVIVLTLSSSLSSCTRNTLVLSMHFYTLHNYTYINDECKISSVQMLNRFCIISMTHCVGSASVMARSEEGAWPKGRSTLS